MGNRTYTVSTHREELTFTGRIIGMDDSGSSEHSHREQYITDVPVRDGYKPSCSACRWFEVTLYRTDDNRYVVHTVGRTIIPGEIDFGRVTTTHSAYVVVDLLTVRRPGGDFLPAPSSRALAQAAPDDDDIRDAYINRAVV